MTERSEYFGMTQLRLLMYISDAQTLKTSNKENILKILLHYKLSNTENILVVKMA